MASSRGSVPREAAGFSSVVGQRGVSALLCSHGVDQRFPTEHRLKHKREFDRVFDQGKRVYAPHFMVVAASGPSLGHHRLGIIVSRKVGKAVVRNKLKRRVREFYRTRKKSVSFEAMPEGADIVVVTQSGAGELDFNEVCKELESCWQKL